ncbi:MAG: hypothetical protein F7B17_05465 [Desulfurococcales archaeon]|nr:hypothetical protein [Desulfurococcales archaeon]
MSEYATNKSNDWREVVEFMVDLFEAFIKSLEAWREVLVKHNTTILEKVRDVRRLREVIKDAPNDVKLVLFEARLSLEEIISLFARDPEALLDEDEFNHVIATLKEARDKLSRALEASTDSGGG